MHGGQAGVFASSGQGRAGSQTSASLLVDLDGDNDLDALIAGTRQAAIWWNDGQGSFSRSNRQFRYSDRYALAMGDFNRDD